MILLKSVIMAIVGLLRGARFRRRRMSTIPAWDVRLSGSTGWCGGSEHGHTISESIVFGIGAMAHDRVVDGADAGKNVLRRHRLLIGLRQWHHIF